MLGRALLLCGCLLWSWPPGSFATAESLDLDQRLAKRVEEVHAQYKGALLDKQAQDPLLRAQILKAHEEVLAALIDADSLFRYFFQSREYKEQYGLLLKQMIWQVSGVESSRTRLLSTYSLFADRKKSPFLIELTPAAFSSLAFLRSILVHELNHVLFHKEPFFIDLDRALVREEKNIPNRPAPDGYSFFFNRRYAGTSYYQYHLIHEYYSFKAQLLYDDLASPDSPNRLSPEYRKYIQNLCEWSYGELSSRSRKFIKGHPDPPIHAYVKRFSQWVMGSGFAKWEALLWVPG